ncbi:DEAD-box ATP-dependent RNA helicase 58, chloroplastic [Orobanche hederae]
MACSSVLSLHSVPWTSPMKPLAPALDRPNFTVLFSSDHTNHMLASVSISASLSSTYISYNDVGTTKNTCSTLWELCQGHVPDHVLRRAEEVGYVSPTHVQQKALPVLFSGRDCVIHAQTGSGKTLAYLLLIFSSVNAQRSSVQALIVVPTRELGIQVTKVARMLAAKSLELESEQKSCTVMALLDGGTLIRHKSWLKSPVKHSYWQGGTPNYSNCYFEESLPNARQANSKVGQHACVGNRRADFMFNSSKEVSSLRKLLTTYSSINSRQTIFASASIPQHKRFVYDCIQHKWTKADVVHVHVNPVEPMPTCLYHRFVTCGKRERYSTLLHLLQSDRPHSAIIFVGQQVATNVLKGCRGLEARRKENALRSEKSKKAGNAPPTTLLIEFLKTSHEGCPDLVLLEEEMNFNRRAACLTDVKQSGGYLLVATDIAARGVDLPETTHIYNFDLPKDAVSYLHRAGRTGRKPFSDSKCFVTSIITAEERFALQRFESELMFQCEEVFI